MWKMPEPELINLIRSYLRGTEVSDSDFDVELTLKIDDWRCYVPYELRLIWRILSIRDRLIVALCAKGCIPIEYRSDLQVLLKRGE